MFYKKYSEETRFMLIIVVVILMITLMFYLINLFTDSKPTPPKPREMTVIVTESEKKQILTKLPNQSVINSVRQAIKQGNNSTAYMQLAKTPKDPSENEELRKALEKEIKAAKRPGIRKETDNPQTPVRYLDESSPRDRSVDALYIYLVDIYGTIWPRICIQSTAKSPVNITSFSINADGKTFTIEPPAIKTEHLQGKVAEYYDALLDKQSYTALQAILKSRKTIITSIGTKGKLEREISDKEIKGLIRILDTYAALGGNFSFIQKETPATVKPARRTKSASP